MIKKMLVVLQQPALRPIYAALWTTLATLLLLQSSGDPVIGPAAPPGEAAPSRELLMLAGHAVVFAGMTALWWWAFIIASPHKRALLITVTAVLVIGATTEALQKLVPDREPSWDDLAMNWSMTVATALIIHSRLTRRRQASMMRS